MIMPLLDASLDKDKKKSLREDIAFKYGVSERSLRRYEQSFRESGFEGLKPQNRDHQNRSRLPENFNDILNAAIILKREEPRRSITTIIKILELEEYAPEGVIKKSTLQRHLYKAGFGQRQMKVYTESQHGSTKRYCKFHRMELVQSDIKYGPKLPIGKNGAIAKTYLSTIIDDHSRFILHSEFYANQEEEVIEYSFKQAILKYGKFDLAYVDNGSQYIAKQLKKSMSMLGIPIKHCPVRSGKSKGVVEKYHQVVDQFILEAKLHKIKTLEELNRYWKIYIEEYYHEKPHDGIKEFYKSHNKEVPDCGITPKAEWNKDTRPLYYIDPDVVAKAFLHHETRIVDKGACISFKGRKYETKVSLIGCKVEVAYDPCSDKTITISYPGIESFTAEPLVIKPFCDPTPAIPHALKETDHSRLLAGLERKHKEATDKVADAISFDKYFKGGDSNV